MAEAAGLAIGIASFAGQFIGGLKQLQETINDYKDAPKEITYMLKELATLKDTVVDIGQLVQSSSHALPSMNFAASLAQCQGTLETTVKIFEDLDKEVKSKRRMGSLKAAWKKKSLEAYMHRIHRAQGSLTLALIEFERKIHRHENDLWRLEITRLHGSIGKLDDNLATLQTTVYEKFDNLQTAVVTHIQSIKTLATTPDSRQEGYQTITVPTPGKVIAEDDLPISQDDDDASRTRNSSREIARKSASTIIAKIHLHLPHWILARRYEFIIESTPLGLATFINARRVVPEDCKFFKACREKDLPLIQNLLRDGKASVYDTSPRGDNAMNVLLRVDNFNTKTLSIVKYLLDQGIDVVSPGDRNILPAVHFMYYLRNWHDDDLVFEYRATASRFFQLSQISAHEIRRAASEHLFLPDPRALEIARANRCLDWSEVTIADRVELISTFARVSPEQLFSYLGHIDWEDIKQKLSPEALKDLVQITARNYSEAVQAENDAEVEEWRAFYRPWCQQHFMEDGLAAFHFFDSFLYHATMNKGLRQSITSYAAELAALGADLGAVGEQLRKAIWASNEPDCTLRVRPEGWGYGLVLVRIMSLGYGSNPEDWNLHVSDPMVNAAAEVMGEFWDLVDHPERSMPGAWISEREDILDLSCDELYLRYHNNREAEKEARRWQWDQRQRERESPTELDGYSNGEDYDEEDIEGEHSGVEGLEEDDSEEEGSD